MALPSVSTLPPKTRVALASGTVIETGGLSGQAVQSSGTRRGLREASALDPAIDPRLANALAELGIEEQETNYLDVTLPVGARQLRGTNPADRIVVEPADPGRPDVVQVILYQDESGAVTWHTPDDLPTAPTGELSARPHLRSGGRPRFTIQARTTEAETARMSRASGRLRGKITSIGRKVLKVLLIPVLSKPAGLLIEAIVSPIERHYRQELIRSLTPENYRQRVSVPFTDWLALNGKRSLLVVHGIFSTTEGVLSELPEPFMREISNAYEGRVIAFDQITVSRGPEDNARFFLETVRDASPTGSFEFDILCHSRGGIVARTLAERGETLVPGNPCKFGKIFFVATPNQGSLLADPEHLIDLVDTFTNLVTAFPDGTVTYSIEVVLAILKLIVAGAETQLPGLAAMSTKGYITDLNRADTIFPERYSYSGAAAQYSPDPKLDNGFITGRFGSGAINKIFRQNNVDIPNDLVVPYAGVYSQNGHPLFPLKNPLLFGADDHVWHSGFFSRRETFRAFMRHFFPGRAEGPEITGVHHEGSFIVGEGAQPPISAPATRPPISVNVGPVVTQRPYTLARERPRLRGGSPASVEPLPPPPAPRHGRETSPTVSPQVELRRDPHIAYHEWVEAGVASRLTVDLAEALASSPDAGLLISLREGQESTTIEVTLAAPGFEIEAESEPKMTIGRVRNEKLETVSFMLTARDPGAKPVRREITAHFWQGNSCLGAVTHYTFVYPQGYSGTDRPSDGTSFASSLVIPPTRREQCDLVISVQGDDEAGLPPFRMTMRSDIPGQEYSDLYVGKLVLDQPGATLTSYLDSCYNKYLQHFPSAQLSDAEFGPAYAAWKEDFHDGLVDLGKKLWTFLPQRFRDEYFRLYRAGAEPKSILIHSDEMILPWELIIPHQVVDGKLLELEPLGQRHILGRWKPGLRMKPHPQHLKVHKFCMLTPAYTGNDILPSAKRELEGIQKLFPKVFHVDPATLRKVRSEVLAQSDIQLLHYSGHGDFDPQNGDLNSLRLEGTDTVDALAMHGSKFAAEGNPLVYLNACHVGKAGLIAGRAGGFGANLVQSGSAGVIAPYWAVEDEEAADFALALYDSLAKGEAMGEALRNLRRSQKTNPFWSAYSFLGDPWTKLDFSELSQT